MPQKAHVGEPGEVGAVTGAVWGGVAASDLCRGHFASHPWPDAGQSPRCPAGRNVLSGTDTSGRSVLAQWFQNSIRTGKNEFENDEHKPQNAGIANGKPKLNLIKLK